MTNNIRKMGHETLVRNKGIHLQERHKREKTIGYINSRTMGSYMKRCIRVKYPGVPMVPQDPSYMMLANHFWLPLQNPDPSLPRLKPAPNKMGARF